MEPRRRRATRRRSRRHRVAALVVAVGVLVASVADPRWVVGRPGAVGGVPTSTWLHLVGYAALAAALDRGRPRAPALDAVVAAVGYGAALEVVQLGLRYRTFDPVDLGVNVLGACLGVGLVRAYARRRDAVTPDD